MSESILIYCQQNWIEIAGSILSLIYVYLSIKQKISLWIFGFLCSSLYVVVFWQNKFYADMSLQFYYLAVSVYGWINWEKGTQSPEHELPIRKTSLKEGFILGISALLIYFVYFYILKNFTDSPLPKSDSFTTALSIVATWMLARKMIDNWILWIIIDAVSASLYFYKEMNITAILFVIYTIMAIIGYFKWRKIYFNIKRGVKILTPED